MKTLKILIITLYLLALLPTQTCIGEVDRPPIKPFEQLVVRIHENGDVSSHIISELEDVPVLLPYIKGLSWDEVRVIYHVGERLECLLYFELKEISIEEAKIKAPIALEKIEEWLGVKFDKVLTKMITYPIAEFLNYTARASNFNPDVVTDKFLSLIPNEGVLSLISRKTLRKGDEFTLRLVVGKKAGKMEYRFNRKNYFNFKIGETYKLDVFKLFNFTGPLIVHHLANHNTWIKIGCDDIWTADFKIQLVKAEIPFPYNVRYTPHYGLSRPKGITGFEITNELMFSLKGGDKIEYMRITFKVMEIEFKQPITTINITGMIIVISAITITGIIIYRFKVKRFR